VREALNLVCVCVCVLPLVPLNNLTQSPLRSTLVHCSSFFFVELLLFINKMKRVRSGTRVNAGHSNDDEHAGGASALPAIATMPMDAQRAGATALTALGLVFPADIPDDSSRPPPLRTLGFLPTPPESAQHALFTRQHILKHLVLINTATGWLARWPVSTATLVELGAFCAQLEDNFVNQGHARNIFLDATNASRFVALFEPLRGPLAAYRQMTDDLRAARSAFADSQRDHKALIDATIQYETTPASRVAPSDVTRYLLELENRLQASAQRQVDAHLRWATAVHKAPLVEATAHQQLTALLAEARALLMAEVPKISLDQFLFPNANPF
jgi:hypothetical protein